MLKSKKLITALLTAAMFTATATTSFAGTIPRESTPLNADERAVQITENIISSYIDEASAGVGYALSCGKADIAVREAVIANATEGYGYGYLAPIMKNAIRTICDMRLRPEVYSQVEEELKVLLADLLIEVKNGKDLIEARKEAYILIYKSKNATFNPDNYIGIDSCYWGDIPTVDSVYFNRARKLILDAAAN